MKIRSGFVSNSSSSSFVIFLKKDQGTTPEDMKKMFFGNKKKVKTNYGHSVPVKKVCEFLSNAIASGKIDFEKAKGRINKYKNILENLISIKSSMYENAYDLCEESNLPKSAIHEKCKMLSDILMDEFVFDGKLKDLAENFDAYHLDFSDNGAPFEEEYLEENLRDLLKKTNIEFIHNNLH